MEENMRKTKGDLMPTNRRLSVGSGGREAEMGLGHICEFLLLYTGSDMFLHMCDTTRLRETDEQRRTRVVLVRLSPCGI